MKRMLERIGKEDARCRRLRQIPGFGPLVSTATVAPLVTGRPSAGDASSPLGLVLCHGSTPREASRRNWGILGRFELAMVTKQATATRGEHRGGEC
jgi:transposase